MSKSNIEHHIRNALIQNTDKSESDYVEAVEIKSAMTTVHKTLLLTFFIILILLGIASQARIDIVVSSRGELLLESDIEKVQHLEGGILDSMLVKPGDIVYEGQPIARLRAIERNSQLSTMNAEIAQLELDRLRYLSLIAQKEPDYTPILIFRISCG